MITQFQSYAGVGDYTNLNMRNLPRKLDGDCYAYPHHEVFMEGKEFRQTRSGPNWQGGAVTMATCKHFLRSTRPPEQWEGAWLAGFAPKAAAGDGRNYLLYLAQVERAFPSNYELGRALTLRQYKAKLATNNPLGDIFEPKKDLRAVEQFSHKYFVVPTGHVREVENYKDGTPKWWRDVEYNKGARRPACLLMGHVFMFSKPILFTTRPLHRSGFRTTAQELVNETLAGK